MPAEPRGWTEGTAGAYVLRYYDLDGVKQRARSSTGKTLRFKSKSEGRAHFRDVIAPRLRGDHAATEYTLREFVDVFLDRHVARARTIGTLRERLAHATATFGDVPLRELENMTGEIAAWYKRQPEGSRYGRLQAFRQCLGAAIRWKQMTSNPALEATKNRQPPPREIRVYTLDELDALTADMPATYRGLPHFAAATGLRTEEWAALDARRDIDRAAGVVRVARTVTGGKTADDPIRIVELGKTDKSRREVPLTARAIAALDSMPPRIGLLFPAPAGGPLNLDNWRRRTWAPAVEASGIDLPARPYDTRSTYASNAIGAGVELFELATVMGTSTRMIEKHYGRLLGGARAGIAARLDAFHAEQERGRDRPAEEQS
jgi:hypothetical protein